MLHETRQLVPARMRVEDGLSRRGLRQHASLHFHDQGMQLVKQCGRTLLPQRMALCDRQVLLARLAIDGKQRIHQLDNARRVDVFRIDLDCFDKLPPRVSETAGMSDALGADLFAVAGISIGVQYAGVIFKDLFRHLAAARHFEVEDHASTGRTVLPEVGFMVRAFLFRRLYPDGCFVGLDVTASQQIALHHIDYGNQQLAHAQHRIVDGGKRHIDAEIAQEYRALTIKGNRVRVLVHNEVDDHFVGEDRLGRDAHGSSGRLNALHDARRTGALLALDDANVILDWLLAEHFGLFVADDAGLSATPAAGALFGRARNDFFNTLQMRGQLFAARMRLALLLLLLRSR